jgi:hypothetical protein
MRTRIAWMVGGAVLLVVLAAGIGGGLGARERSSQVSSNDPTLRLYSLLDSKYSGKLDDFCMLADLISDPKNPGQQLQRVVRLEYNKDRGFGKLSLHVRTVAALTAEQLKAYTPKQIYDFAESDSAKFMKTEPGPFGRPGDVYFQAAADGGALGTASATSEVQAQYEAFLTQYVLPALEKKSADGNAS